MPRSAGHPRYRRVDAAMLRAVARGGDAELPPWPVAHGEEPVELDRWRQWLLAAWADPLTAEAVEDASTQLVEMIDAVIAGTSVEARRARRASLSLCRYLIRSRSRATPFGLFAGIAPLAFAAAPDVHFGEHDVIAVRPDPQWLDALITKLEADRTLMADVEVCVNDMCAVRDGRVHPPASGTPQVSLRLTPPVALALDAAASPVACRDLADKLTAEFPTATNDQVSALIASLLAHRVLVSALRAPATNADPFGHLLAQLEKVSAGDSPAIAMLIHQLRAVHAAMLGLASARDPQMRRVRRAAVREAMGPLVPGVEARLATDLRLDATVTLPASVGAVMETAASALTRLATHPLGTSAWRDYVERFAARYGEDAVVGVAELTDRDAGLGFPVGFLGSDAEPASPLSARDRKLLALAGRAGMDGVRRMELTESVIVDLERAAGRARWNPPHLELCAQLLAPSLDALARGEFGVRVLTASRGAGTMTGRFLHLLDEPDLQRMTSVYAELPTVEPSAVQVQLSFSPRRTSADPLTRSARILPQVMSLGEHRMLAGGVIELADLGVRLISGRLHVVQRSTGQAVEAFTPTALNFRMAVHTPPLARFLAEISRAGCAQPTGFDWGAAAALPFTPALHLGRSILVPACWRLAADELPRRSEPRGRWLERLHVWRERRGVPQRVVLAEGDQHLLLDLEQDAHADLLRTALDNVGQAALLDAPPIDGNGWIGGRAHSLVVPMVSVPRSELRP
jgi:lantibiotic biosynthesis protein